MLGRRQQHSTTSVVRAGFKRAILTSLALAAASAHLVGACIHDSLSHRVAQGAQDYGEAHPFEVAARMRRRRLEETGGDLSVLPQLAEQDYDRVIGETLEVESYQPIRITAHYDNDTINALPLATRAVLFKIVPDAIERFSKMLSVVPVQGNLMASRSCDVQWVTTPAVCKTFVEDETCLEMRIPDSHFAPARACSTCQTKGCATGACSLRHGTGVRDTDFVLYVRAAPTSYCSGSVLAYAASCQKDQFDRPTFGMVNFCPSQIETDPYKYQTQLSTAMHEVTHALGFSAQFFPFMRNDDGTPRTPRGSDGDPVASSNAKCANGQSASYYMPAATNTVQFTKERDTTIARMVTPRVAAFVQSHFGCDALRGAEIENQDDGCLGSHWEERIFEPEYMTPISSFRNVLSRLTLAFFEDSGWYRTNALMAERLHFGANRGCAFATSKCIDKASGKSIAADHFCTDNAAESCTVDATARSVCSVITAMSDIPTAFQYFADKTRGGNNEYADYCPINTGFQGGDCANTANLVRPAGTQINILGETYCPTCKCTASTLRSADSKKWIVNARRQTGCYSMRCPTNATVEISVPVVGSTGGQSVKAVCSTAGEQLTVDGYTGTITCPDPAVVCQRSCPGACSGNGVCNFGTAQCQCNPGFKGDDCATNATAGVSQTSLRANGAGALRGRAFAATAALAATAVILVTRE